MTGLFTTFTIPCEMIDVQLLNMICLLKGKRMVKLHWHKEGGYWNEAWEAARGTRSFSEERGPEKYGYTLREITYEDYLW